jgi:capsular polysaccharide biosynthesis protein
MKIVSKERRTSMEDMDLKIQDVFKILKNRWKIVAGMAAGITVFVAVISFFVIKPAYEVNTKVFIVKEETKDTQYNNNDVQMYQKLLKTYSELIKTKDLIGNAINEKNLDITTAEVINVLEITPSADTQILQISYQNNDKVLAKEVLLAVIDEFIKETKELIPNGTVKVIESAELPQNPISPNKEKNIALACLVGLMMGITIALLMEYMDDKFKTKEQTEKIMELPVIGMIPCGEKK